MGRIEQYHSTLHCLNAALQAYVGFDAGMLATEAAWDITPPPDMNLVEVLKALAGVHGLHFDRADGPFEKPRHAIERAVQKRWFTCWLMDISDGGGEWRWAIGLGTDRRDVHYAMLVQGGDDVPQDPSYIERAKRPILAVTKPLYDAPLVAHHAAQAVREPNPN